MSESENVALVEQAYAALEADDVEAFLDLCAPDIEWVYPMNEALPFGGRWSGHLGVQRFLEAHEAAEEILEMAPSDFITGRDKVIVLGHYRGRAKPAGREWETDFMHVLSIREGKIRRFAAAFDTAAAVEARAVAAPAI